MTNVLPILVNWVGLVSRPDLGLRIAESTLACFLSLDFWRLALRSRDLAAFSAASWSFNLRAALSAFATGSAASFAISAKV